MNHGLTDDIIKIAKERNKLLKACKKVMRLVDKMLLKSTEHQRGKALSEIGYLMEKIVNSVERSK